VGRFRSKNAARELAAEFLRPLNDGTAVAASTMTHRQLVEELYLSMFRNRSAFRLTKGTCTFGDGT
jgi:hypothetical protein